MHRINFHFKHFAEDQIIKLVYYSFVQYFIFYRNDRSCMFVGETNGCNKHGTTRTYVYIIQRLSNIPAVGVWTMCLFGENIAMVEIQRTQ